MADTAEPDLGTLVWICRVLATSPDGVLDLTQPTEVRTNDELHRARMISAASSLEGDTLAYTADLVEAMVTVQRKRLKTQPVGEAVSKSRKLAVPVTEPADGMEEAKSGKLPKPTRKG